MIRAFDFDASLSRAFVDLCGNLYEGDPGWIPIFRASLLRKFSPGFPFYRRAGARHRHFLCLAGNRPLGHASAFVNPDLRDLDGTPVGAVGFFECTEDPQVAAELLGTATDWLGQEGLKRIWGPVQFDLWHGYRFMTRGFGGNTFYGEPYNKPSYPGFFQANGFALRKRWLSVEIKGRDALEKLLAKGEDRYRRLVETGYRFVRTGLRKRPDVETLYRLVQSSYRGFLGITPIAFEEFEALIAASARVFDRRFVHLVCDGTGEAVAFSIAYPDVTPAIRAMRGSEGILARIRYLRHRGDASRVIFYMAGATPEELARKSGIGRAGSHNTIREVLKAGYERILFALMAEDSPARHVVGGQPESDRREYGLYELRR